MKHMIKKIIIIIVLLGIVSLVYLLCVRDWIRPFNADVSTMKNITYFDNQKATDYKSVLTNIHKQSRSNDIATEPYDELAEYYYKNPEHSYERTVWLNFYEQSFLKMSYTFDTINNPNEPYDFVLVIIFPSPEYKFNYFTGPKLKLSYWDKDDQTLQNELGESYGKVRPIFNLLSKLGKEEDFEYYLSPLIFNKNEYGVIDDYEDATSFMIFVYDEYAILMYIPCVSPPNDVEIIAHIVLDDIEKLIKQTEENFTE